MTPEEGRGARSCATPPAAGTVDLETFSLTPQGDAVARDEEGRVHFVVGALPGERVRVEVVKRNKTYTRSRAVELLAPSPHRVEAPCAAFRQGCGACQWQDVPASAQLAMKEGMVEDALSRFARLDPPPLRPSVELPLFRFRTTVRAAVCDGRAGFRQRRSHDVLAVEDCLVAHPRLAELLTVGRYPGAEEVLLRCGARTGERLVATVPAGLAFRAPPDVRTDVVHEVAATRRWRISPESFFQSRPDGADALAGQVAAAADELGKPTSAVDLYSGVGLFAGVLADRGWEVTAVESSPSAVGDAEFNLRRDGVEVVEADVTRWAPKRADLVVADPSRTGLGRKGVAAVAATAARRVVLVSCDAQSLGLDAGRLRRAGYRLTSVTLVDLFPHTVHVEVVSVFDR